VFGNLPYNISTKILTKWIINLENKFWFDNLILMFQKEVADRIIAKFNTSQYGRLTILSNWKLNIKKICDVKPEAFYPKPKVQSSILFFTPKSNFYKINNPNKESIEKLINSLISKYKTNFKCVGQPLRIALVGSRFGPGIYNIVLSLTKDEVVKRISKIN